MPWRRVIVVLLMMASSWVPAAATAQMTALPEDSSSVSAQPPVQLAESTSGELANTGSDPRMLFLAGVALTLIGVGLRLRTADADLY